VATVTIWYFHLVHGGELLYGCHALVSLALVIHHDELQLFPQHAAGLVDLVHRQLRRLGALQAAHVCQGPVGSQLDDVLAERRRRKQGKPRRHHQQFPHA